MHAVVEPTPELLEDADLFRSLNRRDRGRRVRLDEPSHALADLPSRPHFPASPTNTRLSMPSQLVTREEAVDRVLTERYSRHPILVTIREITPSLGLIGIYVIGTAMLLWWFSRALAF